MIKHSKHHPRETKVNRLTHMKHFSLNLCSRAPVLKFTTLPELIYARSAPIQMIDFTNTSRETDLLKNNSTCAEG
jgi:hypothetical protein